MSKKINKNKKNKKWLKNMEIMERMGEVEIEVWLEFLSDVVFEEIDEKGGVEKK